MKDVVRQAYQLNQRLVQRGAKVVRGFQTGMRKAGYYVFQLTQMSVPVDTGYLKSTGWMKFGGSGAAFTFTIGYDASYAIYVHEILENYHPIGEAKFVERPFRRSRGTVIQIVTAAIKAANK